VDQLYRGGVALRYDEAGKGAPPILLVHELGGDHTWLRPQFEHFRLSHRTVAVDLRGHGESGKPAVQPSKDDYADDLAWLSHELGLRKPVLIGQGVGGLIALRVAIRYPSIPAAIVALPSPSPPLGATSCTLHREEEAVPGKCQQPALGVVSDEACPALGELGDLCTRLELAYVEGDPRAPPARTSAEVNAVIDRFLLVRL